MYQGGELEETYGHPKIVSRSYIQSLLNVPKINCNDYKSLLKVSQNINGSVSSLKSGGYQHELQSSRGVGNSNLPHSLRLSFLLYLTKNESFLHLFAPEFLILSYSFFCTEILSYSFFCTEKVFLIFLLILSFFSFSRIFFLLTDLSAPQRQ